MEPQTTTVNKSSHKGVWIAVIIIIAVALVAYMIMKKTSVNSTPGVASPDKLESLKDSSAPITATDQERLTTLKTMEQSSKTTTSREDILKKLDATQ